jgi:hypothetical protein
MLACFKFRIRDQKYIHLKWSTELCEFNKISTAKYLRLSQ